MQLFVVGRIYERLWTYLMLRGSAWFVNSPPYNVEYLQLMVQPTNITSMGSRRHGQGGTLAPPPGNVTSIDEVFMHHFEKTS